MAFTSLFSHETPTPNLHVHTSKTNVSNPHGTPPKQGHPPWATYLGGTYHLHLSFPTLAEKLGLSVPETFRAETTTDFDARFAPAVLSHNAVTFDRVWWDGSFVHSVFFPTFLTLK